MLSISLEDVGEKDRVSEVGRNAISFLYNGNIDHLIHVHLTVLNFFFLVFLSFWFKFVMHVVGSVVTEYF